MKAKIHFTADVTIGIGDMDTSKIVSEEEQIKQLTELLKDELCADEIAISNYKLAIEEE